MTENTTATVVLVSATEVRAWADKRGIDYKGRGRLDGDLIDAFNKAHKSKAYEPRMAQPETVRVLTGRKATSKGTRPAKVRATNSEVRAWARGAGLDVKPAGRIPAAIVAAYVAGTAVKA